MKSFPCTGNARNKLRSQTKKNHEKIYIGKELLIGIDSRNKT